MSLLIFSSPILNLYLFKKTRPVTDYPFETQQEHFNFQRFMNTSDSIASRMPFMKEWRLRSLHPLSLLASKFCTPNLLSISSTSIAILFVLLAPFKWKLAKWHQYFALWYISHTFGNLFTWTFTPWPIRCHSRYSSRVSFDIQHFHISPFRPSPSGWMSVLPFSTCKILFVIHSSPHLALLLQSFSEQHLDLSGKVIIGLSKPNIKYPNVRLSWSNRNGKMWKLISNPISLSASHFILCYKMLTCFTWDLHSDHARQTPLHCIAEGLHLSSALATFDDGYYFHTSTIIPLFKKRWDPPSRAISRISALFPQTLTEDPPQTWYFAEVPHFRLYAARTVYQYLFNPPYFSSPMNCYRFRYWTTWCIMYGYRWIAPNDSQHKRPLVLRLVSILIETPSSGPQNVSLHFLLISAWFKPPWITLRSCFRSARRGL